MNHFLEKNIWKNTEHQNWAKNHSESQKGVEKNVN